TRQGAWQGGRCSYVLRALPPPRHGRPARAGPHRLRGQHRSRHRVALALLVRRVRDRDLRRPGGGPMMPLDAVAAAAAAHRAARTDEAARRRLLAAAHHPAGAAHHPAGAAHHPAGAAHRAPAAGSPAPQLRYLARSRRALARAAAWVAHLTGGAVTTTAALGPATPPAACEGCG